MKYTSIFQKPDGSFFRYPMHGLTLAQEQETARQFDDSPAFGKFRYSRVIAQQPLEQGRLYRLTPGRNKLSYRALDEDLQGQFDYVVFKGPHLDSCHLPANCDAVLEGLDKRIKALQQFRLSGVNSFKFRDLCEEHVFAIALSRGQAQLLGYAHAYADEPSVAVPLELLMVHDG
jgi:hypothetical protein